MRREEALDRLEELKNILRKVDPDLRVWIEGEFIRIGNVRSFDVITLRSLKQASFLLSIIKRTIEKTLAKEV
jgi:hypothetical protein